MKSGDIATFEKVYDAYSSALYGICYSILKDQEMAEDALQDSFVKIWKNIQSYDKAKGTFFTWMLNVARNTSIDKYRKINRNKVSSIQIEDLHVSNPTNSGNQLNINHIGISDLVKKLPPDLLTIIDYLYYKGYTQQEASDELGIPLGTIKSRSRIALKTLKNHFLFFVSLIWI